MWLHHLRRPTQLWLARSQKFPCLARHLSEAQRINDAAYSGQFTDKHQMLSESIRAVKALSTARFDESIDLAVHLNVDWKRTDQRVRGTAQLPHGNGKVVRVAVFASEQRDVEAAMEAGADLAGTQALFDDILKGQLNFDRCIAHPNVMPLPSPVSRVLGPRGLMPNAKQGTVVTDLATVVRDIKGGSVPFRADKFGVVHGMIGKVSFPMEQLLENMESWLQAVLDARPAVNKVKGAYAKSVVVSSTMGPGFKLNPRLLQG